MVFLDRKVEFYFFMLNIINSRTKDISFIINFNPNFSNIPTKKVTILDENGIEKEFIENYKYTIS